MSNNLKIELDPSKIPDVLRKCLEIYHEALDQKRNGEHELSYYNLVLSYNILNVIKNMSKFNKIANKHLQNSFDLTMKQINNEIEVIKQELNLYYNDHLNKLINDDVKQRIDNLVIVPLRLTSLYSQNSKSILINSTDIYSKSYLIKYIKKHIQNIPNVSIIHKSHKIDVVNEIVDDKEYQHKQLVVIFEDIDLYEIKKLEYLQKMDSENIYLICTCTNVEVLPSNIKQIFTEKIHLGLPSLSDITNFLRYKLFNYLEYTDVFQSQYNIPLLENKNLDNIAHKLHSLKKSYMEIDKIINKLFEINCQSSLQQNVFIPMQLNNNSHYNLVSIGSIKTDNDIENNGSNNIFGMNYQQQKHMDKFLYKIPKYKKIVVDGKNYTNINYTDVNNISFEDYSIKEFFIRTDVIKNKNKDDDDNKNKIDVIAMFDVEVSSEELNSNFDGIYQLSYISLKILMYYLSHIVLNKDKINKDIVNTQIEKYKESKYIRGINKLKYYNTVRDFIELIENDRHNKNIMNITNISDLNNLKPNELRIIFSVFDNLILEKKVNSNENNDETNEEQSDENYENFIEIFGNCFNSKYITYFIELEELEAKIYIKYKNQIEHLMLNKNIDIAKELRNIINNLLNIDVSIEIIKNVDGYLLNIYTYDNFDLSKLNIYINSEEIHGIKSIIISNKIFELDDNYCITNDRDIQLLVEKYPQEYVEIYAEDEETWKYIKPKKQEHLDYLNSKYSFRNKFYLYLLNFVLLYQKNNESLLNQEQIELLDNLVLNLQMQIDCMLEITAEFDTDEQTDNENDTNNTDIYWKSFWNTSHAEKEENMNDVDEYNYQKVMSQLHQKFCIDVLFLKKFTQAFPTTKLNYYYDVYKNKINNTRNTQEIFVKSSIKINQNQNNIYSNFELNNHEKLKKDDKLIQNIIDKLMTRHSLYFDVFNNIDFIGVKHNNNIKWYKLQSNTTLNDIYKIGENIIKKENYMSLFKLNNTIDSPIMIKWITAYIVSCIMHFNKKYNYVNMFIACLLYGGYTTNNKHMNIFEIINMEPYSKNIVNKINYMYSINGVSLRNNSRDILKEIDLETGTNAGTEFIYTTDDDLQENNRILRGYNINKNDINLYTKSINLKTEYLEDAINF